ncbi:MAG: glycosyltransferase family protein [Gemmatimonadales bacterium]
MAATSPRMPRVVAIIQARMGSERLPGKVLLDIEGQSMLERVVGRVKQSQSITRVVVATTINPNDDAIATAAKKLKVGVVRGNEEDVLDRFHDAADSYEADVIVRVCADSPFIDPAVIDEAIEAYLSGQPAVDYASNKLSPTFPLGLDVEVFSRGALERAWRESTESFQRSHVTVYIYQNPSIFGLLPVTTARNLHAMRWTVDMPEDIEFARQVFKRLHGRNDFSWLDVVSIVEAEPHVADINSHLRPKNVTEG